MINIEVYTKINCPYCHKAKNLLKNKQVKFKELILVDNEVQKEMIARSGGCTSVPQIFINEKHIGGYDNLYKLNIEGKLDLLIK